VKKTGSPSGNRLRALREYYGKTQLELELEASLGIGYLQRLELGKVQKPESETLERILAALNAQYTERREILELFGYIVDAPLPDSKDIAWAIAGCQSELDSALFPAYLLDCANRLHYWNKLVPKLFAISEPNSMLRMVFDSQHELGSRISNGEVFFPAQIRALRYELQRFHEEAWAKQLVEESLDCERFEQYWQQQKHQAIHIPARPLNPLDIQVDDVGVLSFRLISEPFVQDQRFRVIFYIPADPKTIEICLHWLQESKG
jgi:transcriptional regulator with XRE-family HTH domain